MRNNGAVALLGDLHSHCGISYGHGELQDALENAGLRLDFVSITGHADWPDMDAENPEIAHIVDFHTKGFARLKSLWTRHLRELASFERTKGVVAFPGYEIHSSEHGDYTIVGREHDLRVTLAESPSELRAAFSREYGTQIPPPIIMFPHHLGYRRGARGVNWDSFGQEFSPVVEIYSMHGLAENDRSDKPGLHSMGPFQGYGTMQTGLSKGFRFGVLGNTDHHSGHPGSYGHGLTGIWSVSRDRNAIWSAICDRRTWAMTGDTVRLWFAVHDRPMGSELNGDLAGKQVEIDVEATAAIDYVELVVDGRREQLWWGSGRQIENSPREAIASLEVGWGERGVPASWDVRLEITGASITEVIPKFRGPEVVSPLDREGEAIPTHHASWRQENERTVSFRTMSWGNMTNSTPSTQALAVRLDSWGAAQLRGTINGHEVQCAVSELLHGSISGNLGPIDSPAYLLSAIQESEYSRSIRTKIPGDPEASWAYVRVRLKNGHWAISSPVFAG